jgi:hypothetical protein
VAGVRYYTDANPNTPMEARLQEIQSKLSGGVTVLGDVTTLPHLMLHDQATQNPDGTPGPSIAVLSLWVPLDQTSEAEHLLAEAGFELS